MRRRVVSALRPLHGVAVENPACPGTPDVSFVEGWIELKWVRRWPEKETTPLIVEHYTLEQRIWQMRRRMAGGTCWFLLQVSKDWLLFDAVNAALHISKSTKFQLLDRCVARWNPMENMSFVEVLREPQSRFYATKEGRAYIKTNFEPP